MSRRRARRAGSAVTALAVALVLVVGTVAVAVLWTTGRLNTVVCGGPCGAEAVAEPEGLERSAVVADTAAPGPVVGPVDAAAVEEALGGLLDAGALGDRVGVSVLDPATGEQVLTSGPDALAPASTTKILTAAAALRALDPQQRLTTTVQRDGDRVVLVGGGDPYLVARRGDDSSSVERADLATLAERTATALSGAGEVSLGYDASLFEGPGASSAWEDSYVPGQVVTPISALWAGRGIAGGVRTSEPARDAAATFAQLLRDEGVDVAADVDRVDAPGTPAIAEVAGPSVAQAVEAFLAASDNEASEVMARHVAIAEGREASFEGAAEAVTDVLAAADVPTEGLELNDGSGLSRQNRIAPGTLAATVGLSIEGEAPDLLSGLPVGGFDGTLDDRFDGDARPGAGLVRAKTGTLTGVHSLAGYVIDARGVPIAFAVMVDDTEDLAPLETQAALDDVAAALAGCTCG